MYDVIQQGLLIQFDFCSQEEIDELNRILQKQQEQHVENLRLTVAQLREEQATVC